MSYSIIILLCSPGWPQTPSPYSALFECSNLRNDSHRQNVIARSGFFFTGQIGDAIPLGQTLILSTIFALQGLFSAPVSLQPLSHQKVLSIVLNKCFFSFILTLVGFFLKKVAALGISMCFTSFYQRLMLTTGAKSETSLHIRQFCPSFLCAIMSQTAHLFTKLTKRYSTALVLYKLWKSEGKAYLCFENLHIPLIWNSSCWRLSQHPLLFLQPKDLSPVFTSETGR